MTDKQLTPIGQICTNIKKMEPEFKMALPKGLSPDKFIRTAVQGIQTHRDKNKLANADRKSLYLACQKAASDGLVLDGRESALVVFGGEVVYMPMTQGLVKLARNSGEIANIIAEVVYENDDFDYCIGVDESPKHKPDWFSADRGEPIGAWAMVVLKNGERIARILPKNKIMKIAGKSNNRKQYDPKDGPYFDEWWIKTAVKNVLKYAPRSTELDRIVAADDEREFEYVEISGETAEAEEKPVKKEPVKKETKAAKAVKIKAKKSEPEETEDDIIDAEFAEVTSEEAEEIPI